MYNVRLNIHVKISKVNAKERNRVYKFETILEDSRFIKTQLSSMGFEEFLNLNVETKCVELLTLSNIVHELHFNTRFGGNVTFPVNISIIFCWTI